MTRKQIEKITGATGRKISRYAATGLLDAEQTTGRGKTRDYSGFDAVLITLMDELEYIGFRPDKISAIIKEVKTTNDKVSLLSAKRKTELPLVLQACTLPMPETATGTEEIRLSHIGEGLHQ